MMWDYVAIIMEKDSVKCCSANVFKMAEGTLKDVAGVCTRSEL